MKCINPQTNCPGEMGAYPGLAEGKIECNKCGYRIDEPAKKTKVEKATKGQEETKELSKEN